MRVQKIRSTSATEVTSDDGHTTILISYETVVAYHTSGKLPKISSHKHSVTTTKQVREWLARHAFVESCCLPATPEQLSAMAAFAFSALYNLESSPIKLQRVTAGTEVFTA